jgi:hypothetical protein
MPFRLIFPVTNCVVLQDEKAALTTSADTQAVHPFVIKSLLVISL